MTGSLVWHAPLLLLLLLPLAVLAAGIWRRRPARGRELLLFTLRCVSLLLLVLALAQPALSSASSRPVLFVVDNTASMTGASWSRETGWLRTALHLLPPGTARWLVSLNTQPSLLALPHSLGALPLGAPEAAPGTDLESGLRLALAAAPPDARVVLLSDGAETAGNALAVVPAAYSRHVAIDVVPVALPPSPDAAITRLQLAPTVRQGDPLPLLLTIHSTLPGKAQLSLQQDGQSAGEERLILQRGDNPYVLDLPPPAQIGWHTYRATISLPGDAVPENNQMEVTTRVAARGTVLLVATRRSDPFAAVLRGAGLRVQMGTPASFPTTTPSLLRYDGVVLDDLPAMALGKHQVSALNTAVRADGLGLLVLGGPHSLTLGHYSLTPLERLLPVFSVPPSTLHQGNIGLQLVMDRSGSMANLAGNEPKITMSQGAANIAVDFALQHKDDLGVVSFDIAPHILLPLQRIGTPRTAAHAHRLINAMTADGGTNIYGALQAGLTQVLRSHAPYRHIILMTDGVSNPANYRGLLARIARAHITLSTVGLGQDADVRLLKELARAGRGRFYYTANAADLPHIFAKEVRLSAGPSRVAGTVPVEVGASSSLLGDLPLGALPPVHGYPATSLKPNATAPLVAHTLTRGADPILAQWQYGLGRVLVWTPGSSAWAGHWLSRKAGLWASVGHWMLRGVSNPSLLPQLGPRGVQIDTWQNAGELLNLTHLTGSAVTPSGRQVHLAFQEVGPGQYRAPLASSQTGIYRLTVRQTSPPYSIANAVVARPYSPEYGVRRPNLALLTSLAERTGGRLLTNPRQLQPATGSPAAVESLWWPLAALALLFFFLSVILRLAGNRAERA